MIDPRQGPEGQLSGEVAATLAAAAERNNELEINAIDAGLVSGRPLSLEPAAHELYALFGPTEGKLLCDAIAEGLKSFERTNAHASVAPCSRSILESSHSTDSGPA